MNITFDVIIFKIKVKIAIASYRYERKITLERMMHFIP